VKNKSKKQFRTFFSMQQPDLFRTLASRFSAAQLRYMITGAAASIVYGEPRLTLDLDVVVEISAKDIDKIIESFPADEFYCPPLEIIKAEAKRARKGHFNIIHHKTGFRADIYLVGNDKLHRWAMERRQPIDLSGEVFWLAPIEYVILRKLEYYREGGSEKHLNDISGMATISRDQIDFGLLEDKIKEYGLEREWKLIQRSGE
jgi:hypothetical protein